jgi:hypothetical protein
MTNNDLTLAKLNRFRLGTDGVTNVEKSKQITCNLCETKTQSMRVYLSKPLFFLFRPIFFRSMRSQTDWHTSARLRKPVLESNKLTKVFHPGEKNKALVKWDEIFEARLA